MINYNVIIKKLNHGPKKYIAEIHYLDKIKKVTFGAKGYKDYTKYPSSVRDKHKKAYIARHKDNENWLNPLSAGFYARYILWNKPTIDKSIRNLNRRFINISVKLE